MISSVRSSATSTWSTIPTRPTRSSPGRWPRATTASTSTRGPASSRSPCARAPPPSQEDCRCATTASRRRSTADLGFSAITRVKVKPAIDGMKAVSFDMSPTWRSTPSRSTGSPPKWLQRESLRLNLSRGGNGMFLVVPPEPLRAGREYEFEFRYSGNVIHRRGRSRLTFVAGGHWYPTHGPSSRTSTCSSAFRAIWNWSAPGNVGGPRRGRVADRPQPHRRADPHRGLQSWQLCARARGARRILVDVVRQSRAREGAAAETISSRRNRFPSREHGGRGGRPTTSLSDTMISAAGAESARASADAGLGGRRRAGVHGVQIRSAGAAAPHRVAHSRNASARAFPASSIFRRCRT